jgi:hypothetical protein
MSEDRSRLIERVVGRLTDLRMELDPEERVILDEFVLGEAEVTAHAMDPGAVTPRVILDKDQHVYKLVDI